MQRPCCLLSFSIFGEDEISVLVETHSQAQPPQFFESNFGTNFFYSRQLKLLQKYFNLIE